MANRSREPKRRLMDLLPAIYREAGAENHSSYLVRLLNSFERVLWGRQIAKSSRSGEGLREKIEQLSELLDPLRAAPEVLPWLAGWMALALHTNLRVEQKRKLIANMIPLYNIRGTRRYVEELLRICVDVPTAIEEEDIPALQIGKHSTLGKDMHIGGGAPHFFRVRMLASHLSVSALEEQRELAYEVVELAKPAHTGYEFKIDSPQMQIGVHSMLGIDTVLGPAQAV